MDDNLYRAPQADLAAHDAATPQPRYYVVSPRKFLIMSIATLGYYNFYWTYRNWREIDNSVGGGGWPVMRGLFPLFFMLPLAALLQRSPQAQRGLRLRALAFVGLQLTSFLAATTGKVPGGMQFGQYEMLAAVGAAGALLTIQKSINAVSGDPEGAANDRLTGANWGWIALGLVWWALSANAILFPQ
jgi:hypothetical protein